MKGFKTVLVNIGIVAGTGALKSLAGYDWVSHVGSIGAMSIVGGINLLLRAITSTPIFSRKPIHLE